MVTGAPGAGKTATGREVARQLGAALLDLDSLTNPLVDLLVEAWGGEGYDDESVAPLLRDARYECLLAAAEDCLGAGTSVVLVAPFTSERRSAVAWEWLADRLRASGGEPLLAWLHITTDELGRRLVARSADRDHAKLRDLKSHLATLDLSPPVAPHLAVEAADAPQDQAAHILQALAGRS